MRFPLILSLLPVIGLAALLGAAEKNAAPPASATPAPMKTNPLLTESPLPFHYPQFNLIKDEHFAPAFAQGMADQLKEVDAIATNPAAPTFENTIAALEKTGTLLTRVSAFFFNLNGCNTNPALQAIESDIAPKLAAHNDTINLNPVLFARVKKLYDARDTLGLDPESKRLLWRYYKDFVRAGALLAPADQEKLRKLNGELASLQASFIQTTLKEVNASAVLFDTKEELAGFSEAQLSAAATAAKGAGHEGKYLVKLQNTTGQPPLTELTNHATREKIMAASLARGSRGGEFDTRGIVSNLARKRAERATLLGYPSHAAYQLDEQTVGSVDTLNKLLSQLAPAAVANARREAADMEAIIAQEKGKFTFGAADWQPYSEKVRQARYAFDESQLKPYFELDHVLLDGVFFAAHRLYGLNFKERHDLPVYEPTVRVFDVYNADGSQLAIFLADFYARSNKNGGAWESAYISASGLLSTHPVVANHLNIPRPPAGQPALLTYDEVRTMFHEFGHALHEMFSDVRFPRFAGTSVPTDFVEYPSQVNEMWAVWPEVLQNYAKHYQTGAPIPAELVAKVEAAKKFNQGFTTTEYLAATLLDQAWHQLKPTEVPSPEGVVAFEAAALKKYGVDFAPVPPRYRTTYFSHAFAGGYSGGYYSYLWSEVLDADTVVWIKEHGGLKRENGDILRNRLLSRGGSQDALKLFHDVTGREPYLEPLLVRRGLDTAGK